MSNELLHALQELGPLKVWSLVVTVLGDQAPTKGMAVSGPELSKITTTIGIKPEALRVALHRLRNDGWIISDRQGRISHHRLTQTGLTQTAAAHDVVYAAELEHPKTLFLAKFDEEPEPKPHLIRIDKTTFLIAAEQFDAADAIVGRIDARNLPEWLSAKIVSPRTTQEMSQLCGLLNANNNSVDQATRLLALHHWRRLTLRHSITAQSLMPLDWPGHKCRARMATLLATTPEK